MARPRIVLRPGPGATLQEYWHYLIGYLLPSAGSLRGALGPWGQQVEAHTIVLHSCGPVMDEMALKVLAPIPHSVEFRDLRVRRRGGHAQRLGTLHTRLPRYPARARLSALAARDTWVCVPRLDAAPWWWDPRLPAEPGPVTDNLEALDELLSLVPADATEKVPGGTVLVLERSEQPSFYDEGGGSLVPCYGRGRRHLANSAEIVAALSAAGHDAVAYEPGRHSLRAQAAAFSGATGIVGVRGAEFANLLWARPGTPVVLMNPKGMTPRHSPARQLAALRDCSLVVLSVQGPDVDADPRAVVDAITQASG